MLLVHDRKFTVKGTEIDRAVPLVYLMKMMAKML